MQRTVPSRPRLVSWRTRRVQTTALASFFVEGREAEKVDPKLAEIAERLERIEKALERERDDR